MNQKPVKTRRINILFVHAFFLLLANVLMILAIRNANTIGIAYFMIGATLVADSLYLFLIFHLFKKQKRNLNKRLISKLIKEMPYASPSDRIEYERNSVSLDQIDTVQVNNITLDEQGRPLEILRPDKIIRKTPVFNKAIDSTVYIERLSAYMLDSGLSVSQNTIRAMFSSMASTKCIQLRHEQTDIVNRFIELFMDFIGTTVFQDDLKDTQTFVDMFKSEDGLKAALLRSNEQKLAMHAMVFNTPEVALNNGSLDPILAYAFNPLLPFVIENKRFKEAIQMPDNIWFLLVSNEDLPMQHKGLSQSGIVIELEVSLAIPKHEVYENDIKLTHEYFTNYLLDGYEIHYLEESDWKKFDAIETFIQQGAEFKLDNRLFRQMERFTSTFLLFGGDKHEAIDYILYAKYLKLIHHLDTKFESDTEKDILITFEKQFGLEYLIKSKNVLKSFQSEDKLE